MNYLWIWLFSSQLVNVLFCPSTYASETIERVATFKKENQVWTSDVQLGSLPSGKEFEIAIVLRNESPETIAFTTVNTTCGCLKAKVSSTLIEPNGAINISLTLKTGKSTPNQRIQVRLVDPSDTTIGKVVVVFQIASFLAFDQDTITFRAKENEDTLVRTPVTFTDPIRAENIQFEGSKSLRVLDGRVVAIDGQSFAEFTVCDEGPGVNASGRVVMKDKVTGTTAETYCTTVKPIPLRISPSVLRFEKSNKGDNEYVANAVLFLEPEAIKDSDELKRADQLAPSITVESKQGKVEVFSKKMTTVGYRLQLVLKLGPVEKEFRPQPLKWKVDVGPHTFFDQSHWISSSAVAFSQEDEFTSYYRAFHANGLSLKQFDCLASIDILDESKGSTRTVSRMMRIATDHERNFHFVASQSTMKTVSQAKKEEEAGQFLALRCHDDRGFLMQIPGANGLRKFSERANEEMLNHYSVPDMRKIGLLAFPPLFSRRNDEGWTNPNSVSFEDTSLKDDGELLRGRFVSKLEAQNASYVQSFSIDPKMIVPLSRSVGVMKLGGGKLFVFYEEQIEWDAGEGVSVPTQVSIEEWRSSKVDGNRSIDPITTSIRIHWFSVNKPLEEKWLQPNLMENEAKLRELVDPVKASATSLQGPR